MNSTETLSNQDPKFIKAFTEFIEKLTEQKRKSYADRVHLFIENCYGFEQTKMSSKYIRVYEKFINGGEMDRCVYCFISPDGKIWKPRNYYTVEVNKPRGCIYDENPLKNCGPYGVKNL